MIRLVTVADESDDRRTLVDQCTLFSGLEARYRGEVARISEVVQYPRRETISLQNQLLVVGSGRVRVFRGDRDRGLTIGYRVPGDILGERCWLGDATVEAVAIEPTQGLLVPAHELRLLVSRHVSVASTLASVVAERQASLEDRLYQILSRPVEWRLIRFLLDAADEDGVQDSRGVRLAWKFTHVEIANYIGSTRETVTLILGDLKRSGLIGVEQRRVILRDVEGLRARLEE